MSDLISRQAAINKFEPWLKVKGYSEGERNMLKAVLLELQGFPPAEPERKRGKWIERRHYSGERPVGEWQSCKCSVCGRYDNRQYLYYFVEPRFCSWCGAEMKGE